ncbi:DNA topoisomerase III [Cellulosilyticum sp. I15G10I2]|uniref:DNA topoisomerase III n=1 Tax=Cellulosilyticum sp. I15G10I2 TaxID=1892843 RepID=UPI00085C49C4|nr:DNA topoisomerase III [Cellulosilyticum sp. I15G10I2]
MSKKLVLAEKPSVGKDIARVLKCQKACNGYIEGNDYVVTWALGHLVGLADPESYDDKYKVWSMETLPMLPKDMKLVVLKESSKQFHVVRELLNRKDITEVIIATDAGREGELVARWTLEKVRCKKPLKRLWISSVTDKAILEGFKKLKPGTNYESLYKAAVCRAEGDWLVGLNVTRALTCKYNAQLSAGRVQSATLAMVVKREEEIKNFKPIPYYTITAKCQGFQLNYEAKEQKRLFDEQQAERILKEVQGKTGTVKAITTSAKKQYAPALYDLTELQRDGNKYFGFSPKETLSIMQRLYESHKVLTYPRTDSRYLSEDIVPTLKERLKSIAIGDYRSFSMAILNKGIKSHKGFVDNSKVSDHHAIIPTEESVRLANLSSDERKIYDLVIKRFLSVMMDPFEYTGVTLQADIGGHNFLAKGKHVISKGWKALYEREIDDTEEEDQNLPKLNQGDLIKINTVIKNSLMTKPPTRFTEATLLSAMEKPHQYVTVDKSSAKTLGETGGIGTVATRADIIEKLYNMYYIEKNGKDIVPTSKGKQLIELVPQDLKSPLLTAKWEMELEQISLGKLNPNTFMEKIRSYSSDLVKAVKASSDKYVHDNLTGKRCPECSKFMLEVKGKHGMMYVCQDRSCGYRETISRFTNVRCPQCHKKLEQRGEGEGSVYVCTTCTFRQKVAAYNKQYRTSNDKLNKKDVGKYLKKIQKENEDTGNFAFAEAFSKLNKDNKNK